MSGSKNTQISKYYQEHIDESLHQDQQPGEKKMEFKGFASFRSYIADKSQDPASLDTVILNL